MVGRPKVIARSLEKMVSFQFRSYMVVEARLVRRKRNVPVRELICTPASQWHFGGMCLFGAER
jgi:hypothetical protein